MRKISVLQSTQRVHPTSVSAKESENVIQSSWALREAGAAQLLAALRWLSSAPRDQCKRSALAYTHISIRV
jgi:hypothetical protein